MTRHTISQVIIMGDSLSDRGTMYERYLFGIIPMRYPSGLSGKSPDGRFTNGLVWTDHFSAAMANELTIKELKQKHRLASTDIADAIISRDYRTMGCVENNYDLKNDCTIKYRGLDFVRTYDEGGLTSSNYYCIPSWNIVLFFKRLILTNLSEMREKILDYDKKNQVNKLKKLETLIVEWSGTNDLITVNKKPSLKEVDSAINDRVKNVVKLIEAGYRHFILFNMPDLALVPRFQSANHADRENVHYASLYFNKKLASECARIQSAYPETTVQVFDVFREMNYIYEHPELYQLDPLKKNIAFIYSKDFKILKNGTSPSSGYLFWDDVHPTADVHALLAQKFYDTCMQSYRLQLSSDIGKSQEKSEQSNLRNSLG